MKYLGENSLRTLISLIKGEISLKQDKITAEGVLKRTSEDKIESVIIDKNYIGLEKVGNFKSVSTETNQSLTDIEKENARANIDAANKKYVDDAVANAGMSHPLILQENTDYGDTLPSSPQTGQLFFKEAGTSLFDLICPVGAVYISMNNTSPATLFGGSWTKVEGKFLLGTSSAYPTGSSGGEETHTLTVNEMPSHLHDGIFYSETQGATSGSNIGLNNGTAGYKLSWTGSAGTANIEIHTNLAGGGQAHNNMPPYLAVNMWYRTA